MKLKTEAGNINTRSSDYENLPMKDAYTLVQDYMSIYIPQIGQYNTYSYSFRSTSGNHKRKKNTVLSIDDLLENKTNSLQLLFHKEKITV